MLYAITLSYTSPKDELEKSIDAHKKWLADNIKKGNVIFAGPLEDGAGGFILAYGLALYEMENILADDPFINLGLVKTEIKAIEPGICSSHFYAEWAGNAKSL
ncbi:YciI family protein [Pectobacterium polonicum]|uniref:YciI family protein n=1 Tax=Pectobacterium polonicum TaxID=2485124 RepID=A0AAE9SYY1_9GAMM|nr:YciI family protein [Pectobacterium polonicum]UVO07251.1 YciI family protein [Pectobacterium polonicum]